MGKIGLDIGSSSIGWTIREDDNTFKSGVITFQSGMVKGGYSSPTKDRREARSKRNLIKARKQRKWELLSILLNKYTPLNESELNNWSRYQKGQVLKFPENPNFLKWLKCDFSYVEGVNTKYKNPYEIRVKAISQNPADKLHKHELGRALYHLVQRRGYKDIGEADKETEKQILRRDESGFQNALDKHGTIAKALQREFLDKGKRARNQYPYRNEYEDELIKILKTQGYDVSKNKNGEYNDGFVGKVRKPIIWQNPLKTQKGNIGKCILEPESLRCPISQPIFEIFRAWQFINTIKYYDENGTKQFIDIEFRESLFHNVFLKKDKNFKFEEIKTHLNKLFKDQKKYNYPINKDGIYDTSVSGMPVCKGIVNLFGDSARDALDSLPKYNISNAPKGIKDKYSIYDLWHILFVFDERTAPDKNFLEKFAIENLGIQNKTTTKGKKFNPFARLKSNVTQGYSNLSLKAMCKIIPFLKEGFLYNEAVMLAKIPELMGAEWEDKKDIIKKTVKKSNSLYEFAREIFSITNKLIEDYKGLPTTPINEVFAHKNFDYELVQSDLNDIKTACIGHFGEKTWGDKDTIEQEKILTAVKKEYQNFFFDEKRVYRKTPLLTDLFKKELEGRGIKLNGNLYHHSNIKNKFLEKYTDNKTGIPKLPTYTDRKTGVVIPILPETRIDSIKNPMFNKSMSILRRLINEHIKAGNIDEDTEVIVELARGELNDNNKRAAIERYQREREAKRNKYRKFLEEFNQNEDRSINIEDSLSIFELWTEQIFDEKVVDEKGKTENNNTLILREKEAIKRYELWMEQKGQCMYTGQMISITQLFSNQIDIEHTIPRSLLPDNTMANQTVAYAWYNRDKKGTQIPTQCANYDKDVDGWGTRIKDRLENWENLRDRYKMLFESRQRPKGNEDENVKNKRIQDKHYFKMHYDYWKDKVERFTATEVKDSWARRQLVDTQMVSKYTREFLKTYFKKVAVQKGSTTSDFRKIYQFQGEDEIKSRNRHTHHAIDAAVLTLIPVNSSYRDRLIKEYYDAIEKRLPIPNRVPFQGFNSQAIIQKIENETLIVNYRKDKILKQTFKNVRKRGKLQYLKDKEGKYTLDANGQKILLKANGDTVRSELFAQTYLGKIRDVERYDDGQPKRAKTDWEYKTGKDEFIFVKREPIEKVKVSDKLINSIIDPVIKELIRKQKNRSEIQDYQGKLIRHVRIRTNVGKEVKGRLNYRSKLDYKNKFYSEAGSVPYAILLQQENGIERVMIPIASFELAKAYSSHKKDKKPEKFNVEELVKKYDGENKTKYSAYPDKKLLKVGQKVIVLKDDKEYEKINEIDFQKNRMYVITQFSEGNIWLKYHLEAQSKDGIKENICLIKDEILKEYEVKLNLPEVKENEELEDNKIRLDDFKNRKYRFDTINNSFRLKRISEIIGIDKTKEIKDKLDEYKAISGNIGVEGETPLLKMSSNNWNFLYEGEDFEVSILGELKWINEHRDETHNL